MIIETRYVIAVPDLAASAAYYRTVLGFKVREIGDPGWRFFARDACVIMAGECPDGVPPAVGHARVRRADRRRPPDHVRVYPDARR